MTRATDPPPRRGSAPPRSHGDRWRYGRALVTRRRRYRGDPAGCNRHLWPVLVPWYLSGLRLERGPFILFVCTTFQAYTTWCRWAPSPCSVGTTPTVCGSVSSLCYRSPSASHLRAPREADRPSRFEPAVLLLVVVVGADLLSAHPELRRDGERSKGETALLWDHGVAPVRVMPGRRLRAFATSRSGAAPGPAGRARSVP